MPAIQLFDLNYWNYHRRSIYNLRRLTGISIFLSLVKATSPALANADTPKLVMTEPLGGVVAPFTRANHEAAVDAASKQCASMKRKIKIQTVNETDHTMVFHCYRSVTPIQWLNGDTGY